MTKRRGTPRKIGRTVEELTRPVFGRHGFDQAAIITDWPAIVGADIARYTLPEKIRFPGGKRNQGTLHLRIDNSALAVELQHLQPQIIERINGFFGYRAVERIKIIQGPIPRPAREPKQRKPQPDYRHDLSTVADPDLKGALEQLGRGVKPASD